MAAPSYKLSLVLLYAFLEWVLIFMLLLHSLFSYLIFRFADYFGLKEPCFLCSGIGPRVGSTVSTDACGRDLVCARHASEIGRFGYCSAHRKLVVDSQNLCLDCSPSKVTFFRTSRKEENCQDGSLSCSCCEDEMAALLRKCDLKSISQSSRYADDPCIYEKGISDGISASSSMIQQPSFTYDEASFRDLVEAGSVELDAENKSTQLIRDFYSNENVVEFTFLEDKSIDIQNVDKDCGESADESRDGYQAIVDDGLVSETDPLVGHGKRDSCAVSLGECKGEPEFTLIKDMKVNKDDESYSFVYTTEGDLVMDLCRNLASTKSAITRSGGVDTIQQIQVDVEHERDEVSHLAHGEILGSKNIEKAERVEHVLVKSDDIPTQSCHLYTTIGHVHKLVPHPEFLSRLSWTEDLFGEHVEETSTPGSVDLSSEHRENQILDVVPNALLNSPLPKVEELSQIQVKEDREQAPPLSLTLAAEDHSVNHVDFSQSDGHGSDQVEEIMALNELSFDHPLTVGLIKNEEDKLPTTPASIDGAHSLYTWFYILSTFFLIHLRARQQKYLH